VTAEQRRSAVTYVQESAAVSERRACRWLGVHRAPVRYVATPRRDDGPLRMRPQQLAGDHPRWGAPLLTWWLQREGWPDNHKRIERVYRQAGLAVRKRSRRKLTRPRVPHEPASRPNTRWSMDFMRETLAITTSVLPGYGPYTGFRTGPWAPSLVEAIGVRAFLEALVMLLRFLIRVAIISRARAVTV
jgi:transposase InsO family protein